jgi:predicted histone-like DNA-binding protein
MLQQKNSVLFSFNLKIQTNVQTKSKNKSCKSKHNENKIKYEPIKIRKEVFIMSIKYVKVQRNIHTGSNPGTRYLARIFRINNVTIDQIAKEISDATTVSYPDVLAALKAFEIHVSDHITNGEAVKFGILGMFAPGITATAKTTLAQVDASTIKRGYCRFYPSVAFKDSINKAGFEEANLDITGLQS